LNTAQGSQFTAHEFTTCLEQATIRISMDGRGRALDNIFIERLWRCLKYEDIYLKDYASVPELAWRPTFTSISMRDPIRASTIARLPSYTLLKPQGCCCFSFHLIFVTFCS
jgi:transposase InsO family protein